jgi:RNA polymerase sigma factor (sigma-70 family)
MTGLPVYIARQDMMGHAAADQLDTLYRRFGPSVHRRARDVLRNEDEASDVMQDTFLAYMRSKSSLRGEASPFTVLYQIATFKAVDRLRRNSRWSGVLASLELSGDDAERPAPGALSHEGGLPRVEALRDLALLTEGEPPQVLTAAVLYFVEGYTQEEVGQVLDLDRRQVSHVLHGFAERARKRSSRLGKGVRP